MIDKFTLIGFAKIMINIKFSFLNDILAYAYIGSVYAWLSRMA